ncbi:hypothetical protein Patl1_15529 [Pistacia atlantica]|uniref:Uncharacterized protein n=1 Tax=Pistacia atlantica TaxID=434234 RepID=A0ACC1BBG9_9ROSI|nr:hypothetical protein Patl1_15529 [Pistacia atlantica]
MSYVEGAISPATTTSSGHMETIPQVNVWLIFELDDDDEYPILKLLILASCNFDVISIPLNLHNHPPSFHCSSNHGSYIDGQASANHSWMHREKEGKTLQYSALATQARFQWTDGVRVQLLSNSLCALEVNDVDNCKI